MNVDESPRLFAIGHGIPPSPTPTPTPVPVKLDISPSSVNFGSVEVGRHKGPKDVVVRNPKGSKKKPGITVTVIGVSGGGSPFNLTNGCSVSDLAAGLCVRNRSYVRADRRCIVHGHTYDHRQFGGAAVGEAVGNRESAEDQIERGRVELFRDISRVYRLAQCLASLRAYSSPCEQSQSRCVGLLDRPGSDRGLSASCWSASATHAR